MALTSQQSVQLYGTPAYTGWAELEASYDARKKGLSGNANGIPTFEQEVDKAFEELGGYYSQLLEETKGDLNKALLRLEEDYNTGKRQKMASFNLTQEAQKLAQDSFSNDAEQAFKTLRTRQLERGISRTSMFQPEGGLGIADTENAELTGDINRGQQSLDLQKKAGELQFAQSGELADTSIARAREDIPLQQQRFERDLVEERKKAAGDLALSRQQRAYQRFEAGLI